MPQIAIKKEENSSSDESWMEQFVPAAIHRILNNQTVSVIYIEQDDDKVVFECPTRENRARVEQRAEGGQYVLVEMAEPLTLEQVKGIVEEPQFEQSNLWFYIGSSKISPKEAFKNIFDVLAISEDEPSFAGKTAEAVGLVADGEILIWWSDQFSKEESKIGRANGATDGGAFAAAKNAARFTVKSNTSASCVLNIMDKTLKNAKGKPVPLTRFDLAHRGAMFPHINTHKTIQAKIPNHTPITSGQLKLAQATGKIAEFTNKVSTPLLFAAVAVDTVRVGMSVYDDVKNKTSRNTVSTVATVAGGWGGGTGGAFTGATIGTAIFPGLGTMIGGLIGGIAGGVGGSFGAGAAVDAIADECDYDIDVVVCIICDKKFKRRTYCTGDVRVCPDCEK